MGSKTEISKLCVDLDTNVLVSALAFSSNEISSLRTAWHSGRIVPLINAATVTEFIRVLTYPKIRLSAEDQNELLDDILTFCESVTIDQAVADLPQCRDKHDLIFLVLASAGEAEFLITGDADLLTLSERFSIPIATPSQFKARCMS